MRIVAAATRTTQNTDDAEAWACAGAAVLEAVVARGSTICAAAEAAAAELREGSGGRAGAGEGGGWLGVRGEWVGNGTCRRHYCRWK